MIEIIRIPKKITQMVLFNMSMYIDYDYGEKNILNERGNVWRIDIGIYNPYMFLVEDYNVNDFSPSDLLNENSYKFNYNDSCNLSYFYKL